jgi:hypothetical protein
VAATETIRIPRRFNGPLGSGNGGYCSGVVAGFADGTVEVSLRRPVPLDTPLEIRRGEDGSVLAVDGDELVAEGRPAPELALDVPAAVSLAEARAARSRYRGLATGPFANCFVCGRAREDAFDVQAGCVEGRDVVASPWTPAEWTADESGAVRPEIVWAVLDCPTYFATYVDVPDPLPPAVLARFAARIDAPVPAGDDHVVIGWPTETDGRKRRAGSAVMSSDGELLAVAEALLIEPRSA